MLTALRATHSLWSEPLLLVSDGVDQTLPIEDDGTLTFTADPALVIPMPSKDDGGRVSIDIQIGNDGDEHRERFALLKGVSEFPAASVYWYDVDADGDFVLVLGPVNLQMHVPTPGGAVIKASLRSVNDEKLPAQPRAFRLSNTPTMRGLWT